MTLGPEKAALLANAGELVRALKLRRMGNLVLALRHPAAEHALEPGAFAGLLADLYLTRRATGAYLEGRAVLDPRIAWVQDALVLPLALLHPGSRPSLTHLGPGTPTDALAA